MKPSKLPLVGTLASLALFTSAASRYPGGYRLTGDFISTLFAPSTPAGVDNAARPIAVVAMLVFCVACLGLVIVASTMYYGHVAWRLLPLAQKSSMAACTCWLLTLQLVPMRQLSMVEPVPAK